MAGILECVPAKSSVDRASSNKESERSVGTLLTFILFLVTRSEERTSNLQSTSYLAPGIKHRAGALHKYRVKSKFWVGQEFEKEILVEEVAHETSGFPALCRGGVSGNGVPEGGANVRTGNSARGLAYVRRDDERRSSETFRNDPDMDPGSARQSNSLPEDARE